MPAAKNRRANHGRKSRVDKRLPTNHHKAPVKLRIPASPSTRMTYAIFPPVSSASLHRLIPENVLYLGTQFVRRLIDQFQIARFNLRPRPLPQIIPQHRLNKSRPRPRRSATRSMLFNTSFESVIEVFSFIPPSYHPNDPRRVELLK